MAEEEEATEELLQSIEAAAAAAGVEEEDEDEDAVVVAEEEEEEAEGLMEVLGSASMLLQSVSEGREGTPTALRQAEGTSMAYINHASNGGASVFVDGELVATVGEAAAAHLPMICGGVRLEAKSWRRHCK